MRKKRFYFLFCTLCFALFCLLPSCSSRQGNSVNSGSLSYCESSANAKSKQKPVKKIMHPAPGTPIGGRY
ncbi:MAG: hypothetical protein RRX93_04760 [Bacteroidales bacterium]